MKAPFRVSIFVWTAAGGKFLTTDNLMKNVLHYYGLVLPM